MQLVAHTTDYEVAEAGLLYPASRESSPNDSIDRTSLAEQDQPTVPQDEQDQPTAPPDERD